MNLWPFEIQTPRRLFVTQRRFLRPEVALIWADEVLKLIDNEQVSVEIVPTWYGTKVVIWLTEEA